MQQAVIDKATVPIDYESRIARLSLNEAELPKVDSEFEDITTGEEEDRQQKLKIKWDSLKALGHVKWESSNGRPAEPIHHAGV